MSEARFSLEASLTLWRRSVEGTGVLLRDDLDELEQHLRDQVAGLTRRGLSPEAAFKRAMQEMGDYGSTEGEYRKVYWGKLSRRGQLHNELGWRASMLRSYVKVAYRNLVRQKGYAFINIFGLALGLAVCLLIALYVRHELSYDRYNEKADRIYRLVQAFRAGDERTALPPPTPSEYQVWGNAPVGPALQEDFPEVETIARFSGKRQILVERGDVRFQETNAFFADSTVFDVFTWPLVVGDPQTALTAPYTLVLTESTARKYFGAENPVGQPLVIENDQRPYTVTGVVADLPSNSHFTFDVLISMSTFRQFRPEIFDVWGYVDHYTYFTLKEGARIEPLEAKLPEFAGHKTLDDPNEAPWYFVAVEPLTEVYLHSVAERQPGVTGNLTNLYVFSAVGLFILLIACINFMNLATARSTERAKEVGVRKVVGAQRAGLVGQFLSESVLIALISCVLALALATALLPLFSELAGKAFSYSALFAPAVLAALMGISVLVGLLAGSYPALILSRFRPALVLKGAFRTSSHGAALRRALVVFQFGISIALLAGTFIVFSQLNHMRSRGLGFEREQMLVVDFGFDGEVQRQIETVKAAFEEHPAVLAAAASRTVPGGFFPGANTQVESADGQMQEKIPNLYEVDLDFIPVYGIEMAAGRPFSQDFPSDTTQALVINEAAAKLYGYANPQDAVGKKFDQWGRQGTVIGVTKDFNYESLHKPVAPLALRPQYRFSLSFLTLQVRTENLSGTMAELEGLWNRVAPQRPFQYRFLNEALDEQYRAEEQFGQVFTTFTALALLVACLGLLGLISFIIRQRMKEIGVRKVLGASVPSIVGLLSRDFVILVGAAFLIAAPVAYYAMEQWLGRFPYRIELGPAAFLLAGAAALAVALLTVSYQAVRAAHLNPVDTLRYE